MHKKKFPLKWLNIGKKNSIKFYSTTIFFSYKVKKWRQHFVLIFSYKITKWQPNIFCYIFNYNYIFSPKLKMETIIFN